MGFGPQDWDLGPEAGIWALRLRYGPGGWGEGGTKEKKEKEEKEEKIPHMCESRRIRENPEESGRIRESPGESGRFQENPGESGRIGI